MIDITKKSASWIILMYSFLMMGCGGSPKATVYFTDREAAKKNKNVIKHDDNDFVWYERIENGRHGIANADGEIIIPCIYDSIFYTYQPSHLDEEFILFFHYNNLDNVTMKGVAVANRDLQYIIKPQLLCNNVEKHHVYDYKHDEETGFFWGPYYYYDTYCEDYPRGKSNGSFGVGVVDSKGVVWLEPVCYSLTYFQLHSNGCDFPFDNFRVKLKPNDKFGYIIYPLYIDKSDNSCKIIEEDFDLLFGAYYRTERDGEYRCYPIQSEMDYLQLLIYKNKLFYGNGGYIQKGNRYVDPSDEQKYFVITDKYIKLVEEGSSTRIEYYDIIEPAKEFQLLGEYSEDYKRRRNLILQKNPLLL